MPPFDNRNHPMIQERNDMMLKRHVMKAGSGRNIVWCC